MKKLKSKNTTGSEVFVWDHEAALYDSSRQADPVYRSCIDLTAREIPRGTPLCLDGGCGTGLSTVALSDRCRIVVAVDYSFESLKILKSKGLRNVIVVQADLTALPFRESAFNASICANTLQHFRPDGAQQRAVAEIERVTKNDGVISISVHQYSRNKRRAGWVKEGKPGQPGIDYIFRFTRRDLRALIPDSVIKGVGFYGFLKVPFFGSRLQNLLATLLGTFAGVFEYGHMLISVAKKRNRTR